MKLRPIKPSTIRRHKQEVARTAQTFRQNLPLGRFVLRGILWHAWLLLVLSIVVIGPQIVAMLWSIWKFLERNPN